MNTANKLFAWLGRAMGDGESPSASRLIAVPALLANNLLPVLIWSFLSISNGGMAVYEPSVMGAQAAINTALLVFVNAQKRLESKQ